MSDRAHDAPTTGEGAPWWAPYKAASDDLPPEADEGALGTCLGAVAVAVSNAIAIEWVVPRVPLGLRLMHHFFSALIVLAVGAWLALPLWLIGRRWPKRELGWGIYALLSAAGMYGMLAQHLERQANAVLGGRFYLALFPLYVFMCGLAPPAGHFLGGYLARLSERIWPGFRWLGLGAGLIALCVSHVILPDDYPGVHAAIMWVAACVLGTAMSRAVRARLSGVALRRLAIGAAVAGVVGVSWAPPNRVRQQLFRENGSAPAWVLAQLAWRLPALPAEAVARGAVVAARPLDDDTFARARHGIGDQPVVVLLTVDALRGDVVQDREHDARWPRLAFLRDHGANFTRATSAGSQTSVSLTSMFTGRYFSQLYWDRFGEGATRFLYAASDDAVRWPALLTGAGVATHSVLGLIFLQDRFGIARGFAHQQVVVEAREHAHAQAVMTPLIQRLQQHREGPAFFYAHIMEPHQPYDRGRLKHGSDWERYLSEVDEVDRWIGKLLGVMQRHHRRRGYLIVSSDHGEAFGEHGTQYHTKTLYEELVHVPLLAWGPGIPARRIDARVGLVDLGPTVLHLYGLRAPDSFAGASLLPLMRLDGEAPERPVFAEGRLRRAYYRGRLKIIEDTVHKVVEVYDLEADPGELYNLFDALLDRGDAEALRAVAELRAWFEAHTLRRDGYRPPYKP